MKGPIRVLVVDDSALMRKLIPELLARDPWIQVVGTAMDGDFALKKIAELDPHVVTLDLEMPRMDGIETLRLITRKHRLPVIVVARTVRREPERRLKHWPWAPSTSWPNRRIPPRNTWRRSRRN